MYQRYVWTHNLARYRTLLTDSKYLFNLSQTKVGEVSHIALKVQTLIPAMILTRQRRGLVDVATHAGVNVSLLGATTEVGAQGRVTSPQLMKASILFRETGVIIIIIEPPEGALEQIGMLAVSFTPYLKG